MAGWTEMDGVGWMGMGWDGMGWDGMGWDVGGSLGGEAMAAYYNRLGLRALLQPEKVHARTLCDVHPFLKKKKL